MMIDNIVKGSRMIIYMPRKIGRQTIKEAICRTVGHDVAADSWYEGEKMDSLYCTRCDKWFLKYKKV